MVAILVSHNSEVLRQLRNPALERLSPQVSVVGSGDEALRYLRQSPPEVAVLDVRLPIVDGWDVCRQAKAEASTQSVPIILVAPALTNAVRSENFRFVGMSRCDDVLIVPAQPEDLWSKIAGVLGYDARRHRRYTVTLSAQIRIAERTVVGRTRNLSRSGALVQLPTEEIPGEMLLRLRALHRSASVVMPARKVWAKSLHDGSTLCGVQFGPTNQETQSSLCSLMVWDTVAVGPDHQKVTMLEDITHTTEEEALVGLGWQIRKARSIDFSLEPVRYVDAIGAGNWMRLIESIGPNVDYRFAEVSRAFLDLALANPRLLGRGAIAACWIAPRCPDCQVPQTEIRVSASDILQQSLSLPTCPACGGQLVSTQDLVKVRELLAARCPP